MNACPQQPADGVGSPINQYLCAANLYGTVICSRTPLAGDEVMNVLGENACVTTCGEGEFKSTSGDAAEANHLASVLRPFCVHKISEFEK
jgi:hypothetical protein